MLFNCLKILLIVNITPAPPFPLIIQKYIFDYTMIYFAFIQILEIFSVYFLHLKKWVNVVEPYFLTQLLGASAFWATIAPSESWTFCKSFTVVDLLRLFACVIAATWLKIDTQGRFAPLQQRGSPVILGNLWSSSPENGFLSRSSRKTLHRLTLTWCFLSIPSFYEGILYVPGRLSPQQ